MTPLAVAWAVLALALPLSVAASNGGWCLVLICLVFARPACSWSRVRAPLALPLAAAAAVGLLSAFLAGGWDLHAIRGDFHRLWLSVLFAFGLAPLAAASRRRIALSFGLGAAIASLAGIAQAAQGRLASGMWWRAHGWVHPVTYGELVAFAALGAAAALAAKDELAVRHRRWALGALALYVVALLFSGTRGAVMGFAAGLFCIAWAAPGLRRLAAWAIPAGAAAFAAADLLPYGETRSVLREVAAGASGPQSFRLTLWRSAWGMFRERPLLGVGPGQYRAHYLRFASVGPDNEATAGNAHNLIAHQLAERGLAGLACLLWLFAALWLGAWRRAARAPDLFGLWALSATAAFTVMNLTEVALHTEQVWMTFFFIWMLGVVEPAEAA